MIELSCRDVVDFLSDYVSRDLNAEQRLAFDAHLAVCDECVAYIHSYEQTVQRAKAAFDTAEELASDPPPAKLIQAILAARRRVT